MAKPSMIIDVLAGPGDEEREDEDPVRDDEDEGSPTRDPEDLIASIEQQLAELRRSVAEMA